MAPRMRMEMMLVVLPTRNWDCRALSLHCLRWSPTSLGDRDQGSPGFPVTVHHGAGGLQSQPDSTSGLFYAPQPSSHLDLGSSLYRWGN